MNCWSTDGWAITSMSSTSPPTRWRIPWTSAFMDLMRDPDEDRAMLDAALGAHCLTMRMRGRRRF